MPGMSSPFARLGSGFVIVVAASFAALTATAKDRAKDKTDFVCTQVMGVSVTGDWYSGGFETGVDDGRFQAMTRKHGFIEFWADPSNEIWSVPVVSPCTKRSNNPDRVVLTTVNWNYKTVAEWTLALNQAVATLKSKYKGLRRIELLTMLRGPGNATCGDPKTVVAPAIDEAIAKVAAAHVDLVVAGPKIEAPACTVFTKGGPHYVPEGFAEVAKVYAAHYSKN